MYYTTKEVAKILKCDPETVRRKIRSGKLKSIMIDGKHKISEESLVNMIKKYIKGIDVSNMNLEEILSIL